MIENLNIYPCDRCKFWTKDEVLCLTGGCGASVQGYSNLGSLQVSWHSGNFDLVNVCRLAK